MAVRDKMAQRSYPFLEPGEQIQQVFQAQTGVNPYLSALSWLVSFWIKVYVVVVTDRAIVLLRSSIWTPASPKSLYKRLDRHTTFGALSGIWATTTIDGEKFYVNKRWHADAAAADAQVARAGAWEQQPPAVAPPPFYAG